MIWVMDSIPWQCSKLYFYEDKPYNSQQYQQTTEQSVPRICLEINSQKESNWILILTWADLQLRFLLDFSSLAFWRKSLSQCLPNPTSIFFCFCRLDSHKWPKNGQIWRKFPYYYISYIVDPKCFRYALRLRSMYMSLSMDCSCQKDKPGSVR